MSPVDELVDLTVAVAGYVSNDRMPQWFFVQPVNRHDRKELADRPVVWQRLKQREVAEVRIAQHAIEPFQLLWHVVQFVQ